MAGRTDRATRPIKAPPAVIYRAFVDPEALVSWLPPKGMTGHIERFDPRPGGRYRMTLTYDQPDASVRGKSSDDDGHRRGCIRRIRTWPQGRAGSDLRVRRPGLRRSDDDHLGA